MTSFSIGSEGLRRFNGRDARAPNLDDLVVLHRDLDEKRVGGVGDRFALDLVNAPDAKAVASSEQSIAAAQTAVDDEYVGSVQRRARFVNVFPAGVRGQPRHADVIGDWQRAIGLADDLLNAVAAVPEIKKAAMKRRG